MNADSTSDSAISFGVRWRMRAFDQGDHAVEKRLAGRRRDAHDDAIGQDACAAGDAGAIAAGLADDRRGFAGDGRLVDESDAFDDLAVAGNHLAGFNDDAVARSQLDSRRRSRSSRPRAERKAGVSPPRLAQRIGLGLAARLGQRRREVGEQHRQEQPDVEGDEVAERRDARREAERHLPMTYSRVRTVPISTTNITGFFHWMSGRSMTNDCFNALTHECRARRARCRRARSIGRGRGGQRLR